MQHSIVASKIISRTASAKEIDMALLQELWYCEGHIRGLNISGYTLFSVSGTDRSQACILMRNETAWMLPGFSCRDLVTVIRYNGEGAE
jgi:membrane protease subunit (stomatin/prohibitin family)